MTLIIMLVALGALAALLGYGLYNLDKRYVGAKEEIALLRRALEAASNRATLGWKAADYHVLTVEMLMNELERVEEPPRPAPARWKEDA